MEYYNNILCLTYDEMLELMPKGTLGSLCSRGKVTRVRRAGYERSALYALDDAPQRIRIMAYERFPELNEAATSRDALEGYGLMEREMLPDMAAVEYYANYITPMGEHLTDTKQAEYVNNAMILNACTRLWQRSYSQHARQGRARQMPSKGDFWERTARALPRLAERWPHSLPMNARRLQAKHKEYQHEGYASLVNGRFGNSNSRKVTAEIEQLIMSIYSTSGKRFVTETLAVYNQWLAGKIEIVNQATGELFDRTGAPKITESTVHNVVNTPQNRRIADLRRNDTLYNKSHHTPHVVRHAPQYAFSKISMDDRDLTRKTTAGERISAYYAYDVASGCVIAAAYSKQKDMELVLECFRDMFRFITRHNLRMPYEVEVEHHLMNNIREELEVMFPAVRFCQAGNSQEKRAEHLNRAKKYSAEKQLGQVVGRWWARSEAYRERSERVGAEYKEQRLPYSKLVAEDLEAIALYNSQCKPGETRSRLEVLLTTQNPNLQEVNRAVIMRSIGHRTETTLRRSQYVQVQYSRYQLPDPTMISRFRDGNSCTAYWLEEEDGTIPSVILYQGDRFIAECKKMTTFNESIAERTAEDEAAMTEQLKYVAKYHKMNRLGREEKIRNFSIIDNAQMTEAIAKASDEEVVMQPLPPDDPYHIASLDTTDDGDWLERAIKSL